MKVNKSKAQLPGQEGRYSLALHIGTSNKGSDVGRSMLGYRPWCLQQVEGGMYNMMPVVHALFPKFLISVAYLTKGTEMTQK